MCLNDSSHKLVRADKDAVKISFSERRRLLRSSTVKIEREEINVMGRKGNTDRHVSDNYYSVKPTGERQRKK